MIIMWQLARAERLRGVQGPESISGTAIGRLRVLEQEVDDLKMKQQ